MTHTRFMLIAGEPSGDILAAGLVRELRAQILRLPDASPDFQPVRSGIAPEFFGAGGPQMAGAGVKIEFDLTAHAVVGLFEVLKQYRTFKRLFNQLLRLAFERQPDVIIFVDFGGFNRRLAHALKSRLRSRAGTFNNWQPRLVQLVSPQVWASRENRARQMARDLDLLLAVFPFEKDWYASRFPGFKVEYIGHPMLDRYAGIEPVKPDPPDFLSAPLVALLPGSRKEELQRHFPVMLEAFWIIRAAIPSARAIVVLPNDYLAFLVRQMLRPLSAGAPITVQVGGLPEMLSQAALALASTGTVTMECAFFGVPTVTLYQTSWGTYEIGKFLIKVNSLTMPNLLAGGQVFPEFIQDAATPVNLSRAALELLRDEPRRLLVKSRLREIIASLGGPGATRRAALAVLSLLR